MHNDSACARRKRPVQYSKRSGNLPARPQALPVKKGGADRSAQASNFRRVLGCPGSPRFHFQKPVWWLPMTGGHRWGDLQLHFPGPMAVSASADGRVPGF